MKTIQEIKNNYAQEIGYDDWEDLRTYLDNFCEFDDIERINNEICIRAQKVALEKAADNVWNNVGEDVEKICPSITNPENLLR